ncbi:hypothetical protein F2P79_023937 [Pimephales promelas]|nr:hypothetical protein F2P79_023937 [Pimephales promelas]
MSTFPSPDWCAQESLFIPWSMCVNRPAVCVAVMLLLALAHGKRACDYSVIISTYRAVILVELQNLNLTGSFDISKEKDHCSSVKVHRILRDIYNMTQIFRCLSESKRQQRDRGDRGGDMAKVVGQMAQLIRKNCCRPQSSANRCKKASCEPGKKRKGKQQWRMKMMGRLINCWQRLLSVAAY